MADFLTTASTMMCPHGGTISASTSNTKVQADGAYVLRPSEYVFGLGLLVQYVRRSRAVLPGRLGHRIAEKHGEREGADQGQRGHVHRADGHAGHGANLANAGERLGRLMRQDYAFPFRIDPGSRKVALAPSYEVHVEQLIRQVLLTSPGERVDLPDFGCGVRRLLFAPNAEALQTTVQISVQQSLARWLSQHITVQRVTASSPQPEGNAIVVRIDYMLRETLSNKTLEVIVR